MEAFHCFLLDSANSCSFSQLLQTLRSSRLMDELRVGELFTKFYGELALKAKIPDTGKTYLNVSLKCFSKFNKFLV